MRTWQWLPVLVRAVIVGCVVVAAGGMLTGPLIFANLKFWPAVPWSVPVLAAYMWLFWQYLQGRWWPRSTAEARRQGLRARRLSLRVWRWAMIAGYLAMVSSFALHWVVGRLAPLRYGVPEVLQQFPFVTLLAILLMASAMAGIVEEAAFRGYMQGPIERRHGPAAAILALRDPVFLVNLVVTVVFGVAAIWAFRRLASVARIERGTIPS